MDRIDLHIEVTPVPFDKLAQTHGGERSADIRERVVKARQRQTERFQNHRGIFHNAQMQSKALREFCALPDDALRLLQQAMDKLRLSARAYDRILKVARTIADLEEEDYILTKHIAEAIQYRSLDREGWLG